MRALRKDFKASVRGMSTWSECPSLAECWVLPKPITMHGRYVVHRRLLSAAANFRLTFVLFAMIPAQELIWTRSYPTFMRYLLSRLNKEH